LKQFNVIADRGKEGGRIYKNRGLVFRILNAEGNKVGVPIKASAIGCKPTLDNLEKKFIVNEPVKEPLKQRTKNVIDECLQSASGSMRNLVDALKQKQIYTVLRQNAEGRLYGITFVDNQNKCVFNGSDLGKGYSAAALQNRILSTRNQVIENVATQNAGVTDKPTQRLQKDLNAQEQQEQSVKNEGLLEVLISPKQEFGNTPFQLLRKKRKKKKKNNML